MQKSMQIKEILTSEILATQVDEIRKTIANDMMQKTDNRGGTTQNAQIKNWYSWTVLRLMFH